jgi:xylan 1,4-beta-xylosidase
VVVSVAAHGNAQPRFRREDFGTVGLFDIDWLLQPELAHLLDHLAASPGAFHGVRVFGAFTSGRAEAYLPESGGRVWLHRDRPIDFSRTFHAFEALTSRGLVPFVVLGFFPPAISASPVQPPATWDDWQTLVRVFFRELAADPRFGAAAIADWWFEVWNEPNEGRFWLGTADDYLALYRATAEVVADLALPIRLGGPAIAYKPEADPQAGPPWMERFLSFLAANPQLPCDFISLHRKGTVNEDSPDPRRLDAAARATVTQALTIDARRFAGMIIVNDEADEKVGFEVPYAPRMDHRQAAWHAAVTVIHATLGARHGSTGTRFVAAADNANLQLVQAPFDGRRSLLTRATAAPGDLLKLPAYGFYELLRLLGDRQGTIVSGGERLFPDTDLYHLTTVADTHVASLLTYYPDPGSTAVARTIDYVIADLPWPRGNVARFQIDQDHGNAYAAAGGSEATPFPAPSLERLPAIRQTQEVALARPLARHVAIRDGTYRERLRLAPFTTLCLWITPVSDLAPSAPRWLAAEAQTGNVVLRWTPSRAPDVFGYEVWLLRNGLPHQRLTPAPLRSALWVDTAPPHGPRVYAVRAVTSSGVASPFVPADEVSIEP